MNSYLASSTFIDWQHPEVLEQAKPFTKGCKDFIEVAKASFEFVRDEIKHSWDYQLNPGYL